MKDWKDRFFSFFSSSQNQMGWDFFHQRRKERIRVWKKVGKIVGIVLIVYLFLVAWPLRGLLGHGFLTGRTLVLFTNEAESRPCGGFLTAYGIVQLFPPRIDFHNSYALAGHDFGEAEGPLKYVSQTKNFWDLGTTSDLSECAETFQNAYQEATGEDVDQVVLFDVRTAEEMFRPFGKISVGDRKISHKNLFAELSRMVSDVDRHDEKSLENRKSPLSTLGKKMILWSILNPTIAPRTTHILADNIYEGNVFIPGVSPDLKPERDDFALVEWNLGGAKSSRFLDKSLFIFGQEVLPNSWKFTVRIDAVHAGGVDEPLSQDWKGGFELIVPKFLGVEPVFLEAEIAPGESFSKQFVFEYEGNVEEFSVFRPRGQDLSLHTIISLFPQQTFAQATFDNHENVGKFSGKLFFPRKTFRWMKVPDTTPPFITLHEIVSGDIIPWYIRRQWGRFFLSSSQRFTVAEVHFNEKVKLGETFDVVVRDRDFANKEVSENMELEDFELLEDGRTLLLGLWEKTVQPDERFYLELSGVTDLHGNEIQEQKRTLITR